MKKLDTMYCQKNRTYKVESKIIGSILHLLFIIKNYFKNCWSFVSSSSFVNIENFALVNIYTYCISKVITRFLYSKHLAMTQLAYDILPVCKNSFAHAPSLCCAGTNDVEVCENSALHFSAAATSG